MKISLHLRSTNEVGMLTPTLAAGVCVPHTRPAKLADFEFLATNARTSAASRRSKLAVVVVPAVRVLTSRRRPRYFPL